MTRDDDKLIWGALINERRNPDADTYDAEGELPGPIAELDPDIEDEEGGCPNLDKLIGLAAATENAEDEVDHLAEAIKDMMKTFLDSDEFEGGLQDAFDITIEQIGDSLGYYNLENIGFTATEDAEGVEDINIDDEAEGFKEVEQDTPL